MFALLHRRHPWHVIERDNSEPKVSIVRDVFNSVPKGNESGRRYTIHSGDEVCRGEAVLIRRRSTRAG